MPKTLKRLAMTVASALLCSFALAEDTARFETLGTITGTLDGVPQSFLVLFDHEKERSFLTVNRLAGQPSFSIIGRQQKTDGGLGPNRIAITIEPPEIGGTGFHVTRVRLIDGQGYKQPLRALAAEGETGLSDFDVTPDGGLHFSFTADFRRYTGSGSDWTPVDSAPGARFDGRFEGVIPETERANLR